MDLLNCNQINLIKITQNVLEINFYQSNIANFKSKTKLNVFQFYSYFLVKSSQYK